MDDFNIDFDFCVYKIDNNILYSKFLSAFVPPQEYEIAPLTGCLFIYRGSALDGQNHFIVYQIDNRKLNRMIDFEFDFQTSTYMKITFLFGKVLDIIKSQELI